MRIVNISVDKKIFSRIPSVACIGYFDGVHLGHQALIRKTVELAERLQCQTSLITFDPDPWVTIKGIPSEGLQHITTMPQRVALAAAYGIQNIYILKFTKAMSRLTPEEFRTEVFEQMNLKGIVCGFDFHYGYKGEGNCETLKKIEGIEVEVVDEVSDSVGKISSTRITQLLKEGKIEDAERLLGHPFVIDGKVIRGRHKGTSMGFPTANIYSGTEYVTLKTGVYACYVRRGAKEYRAMVNLGHNPTMNYTSALSLEAHILDFNEDIYGERISVRFVTWIRPEKDFKNKDNLIMQLEQDVRTVRNLLK